MTRRCLVVAAVVAAALAGPHLAGERKPAKGLKGARLRKPARPKLTLATLRDELNLTSSQEAQAEQLYRTYQQAITNWMSENGPEYRDLAVQVKAARKSGDREAGPAAQQKLRKLMESREALTRGFIEQLGDVLDKDQMAKARALFGRPASASRDGGRGTDPLRILAAVRGLDLTPQQRTRVMEIVAAAVKSIRQEVLSDAQRKQLEALIESGAAMPGPDSVLPPRLVAQLERLDLTDAQKSKIAELKRQALAKAAKTEDPRARKAIFRDLHRGIVEDVLTPPQRRALTGGSGLPRRDRPEKKRRSRDGK